MRRHGVHLCIDGGHGGSIASLAYVGVAGSGSVGALLSSCTASTTEWNFEVASGFGPCAFVAALLTIKGRLSESPGFSSQMASEQVIARKDLGAVGTGKAMGGRRGARTGTSGGCGAEAVVSRDAKRAGIGVVIAELICKRRGRGRGRGRGVRRCVKGLVSGGKLSKRRCWMLLQGHGWHVGKGRMGIVVGRKPLVVRTHVRRS